MRDNNFLRIILKISNLIITLYYCIISGLHFDRTWYIRGKLVIKKRSFLSTHILGNKNGRLIIGKHFQCVNSSIYNPLGLIQPCFFNIGSSDGELIIGNNVGISGTTICASKKVYIGNNVMIGTGCLITDSDIHPIDAVDRIKDLESKVKKASVIIEDNVFIGARCIVLKGVRIGRNSVIGAGSVVSNDVPPNVIVAGNPLKILKTLTNDEDKY